MENIYGKSRSAVRADKIMEWFRTTIGMRQGCMLPPDFFNLILKATMAVALRDATGVVIMWEDSAQLQTFRQR